MKRELILEGIVDKMLNELFNSGLLDEDDVEEKECIEEIINILEERISYY